MTIDKNDPRLTAFVLGELPETEADDIRKALEADFELRAEVEEIHRIVDEIEEAMRTEPLPIEKPLRTPGKVDRPDSARKFLRPETVLVTLMGVALVAGLTLGLAKLTNMEIALHRPENSLASPRLPENGDKDTLTAETPGVESMELSAFDSGVDRQDAETEQDAFHCYGGVSSDTAIDAKDGETQLLGGMKRLGQPDADTTFGSVSGSGELSKSGQGSFGFAGGERRSMSRGSMPPERLENQAGGAGGGGMDSNPAKMQFSQSTPVEAMSNSGRERMGRDFPTYRDNPGRMPYASEPTDPLTLGESNAYSGETMASSGLRISNEPKPVETRPNTLSPGMPPAVSDRFLGENEERSLAATVGDTRFEDSKEKFGEGKPEQEKPRGYPLSDTGQMIATQKESTPMQHRGFGDGRSQTEESDRSGFGNADGQSRDLASKTRVISPAELEKHQLGLRGESPSSGPEIAGKPAAAQPEMRQSHLDSLRMMTTPRVLIQEEEEEVLTGPSGGDPRVRGLDYVPRRPLSESNEAYLPFVENTFQRPEGDAKFSTFSIDVDSAAYSTMRRYIRRGQTPPSDSVRLEEYVNYFHYNYDPPTAEDIARGRVFATQVDVAPCPWQPKHLLARIGIKGREFTSENRPALNLVFLIDVSGSMSPPNKLPLIKQGLRELVEQLRERDRVAVVTYAGSSTLALPSISAREKQAILDTVDALRASGSTAGGQGIQTAYETARKYFDAEAENRVILCTDGDFNVGVTDNKMLEELIAEEAKSGVYLTVLGFGMGNYKDDRLKLLAMRGGGNYGYVDSVEEARRLLVQGLTATMFTIAKDVKIQVDFNPARVAGYRLLGYENRKMNNEDFKDDRVDAGEIGAGHTVTALYEIIPVGMAVPDLAPQVDRSRYENTGTKSAVEEDSAHADELMFVKLRYKLPDASESVEVDEPVVFKPGSEAEFSPDSEFAAAVALYGMLLRGSKYSGTGTFETILELAKPNAGEDKYRNEFIELVEAEKSRRTPPMASMKEVESETRARASVRSGAAMPADVQMEPESQKREILLKY